MTRTRTSSPGKKFFLSFGLVVTSAVYALWQRQDGVQPFTATIPVAEPAAPSAAPAPAAPSPASPAMPMMTGGMPMRSSPYADGSYAGSAADAYYGTVQVKATVRGGKIVDVAFLDYPHTHADSIPINREAMPLLVQEAIRAQSAQVDGVSGATFTSDAFKESLSAALALAKN